MIWLRMLVFLLLRHQFSTKTLSWKDTRSKIEIKDFILRYKHFPFFINMIFEYI